MHFTISIGNILHFILFHFLNFPRLYFLAEIDITLAWHSCSVVVTQARYSKDMNLTNVLG